MSQTTISLVLNGHAIRISEETRERVMAAAAELGYTPNHAARSLRQRSTKLVTFVLPALDNPYFSEVAASAQLAAQGQGYTVTIIAVRNELGELRTSSLLHGAAYDGIVVAGHDNCAAPELLQLSARGVAVVVLQAPSPDPHIRSVGVDLEAGGYMATRHLARLGHRRIAHVTEDLPHAGWGRSRSDGYRRALAEAGLTFDPSLVLVTENSMAGGAEAVGRLVDLGAGRPTAAFMYNDHLAVGGLHALRERGLRVPEDFALVGCDGVTVGRFTAPSLTTIDSSREELGRLAIEAVIGAIEKTPGPREQRLPVRLVVRNSCGGAAPTS